MDLLPPLTALRAFEAAARHESFAQAAAELHVTPAAVSHQVKALEAFVGVVLFHRRARGLTITEAGRAAQPLLRDGLERFREGVARMRSAAEQRRLTISANTSFASMWLISRLENFRTRHPDIDILLSATDNLADLHGGEADIGIRYGRGYYAELHSDRIVGLREFPVCSPALLEGDFPLLTPDDLRHHNLLHVAWYDETDVWPTWNVWLKAAGVEGVDANSGLRFNDYLVAVKAATEGLGVALGSDFLVRDDIAAGRLVCPFELGVGAPDSFAYYLVVPPDRLENPSIAAFRAWLLEETAAYREPRLV